MLQSSANLKTIWLSPELLMRGTTSVVKNTSRSSFLKWSHDLWYIVIKYASLWNTNFDIFIFKINSCNLLVHISYNTNASLSNWCSSSWRQNHRNVTQTFWLLSSLFRILIRERNTLMPTWYYTGRPAAPVNCPNDKIPNPLWQIFLMSAVTWPSGQISFFYKRISLKITKLKFYI